MHSLRSIYIVNAPYDPLVLGVPLCQECVLPHGEEGLLVRMSCESPQFPTIVPLHEQPPNGSSLTDVAELDNLGTTRTEEYLPVGALTEGADHDRSL
jgi:hypothetical protein